MRSFQRLHGVVARAGTRHIGYAAAAVHGLPSEAHPTIGDIVGTECLFQRILQCGDACCAHTARVVNRNNHIGGWLPAGSACGILSKIQWTSLQHLR